MPVVEQLAADVFESCTYSFARAAGVDQPLEIPQQVGPAPLSQLVPVVARVAVRGDHPIEVSQQFLGNFSRDIASAGDNAAGTLGFTAG